jgi:hypothetical protein
VEIVKASIIFHGFPREKYVTIFSIPRTPRDSVEGNADFNRQTNNKRNVTLGENNEREFRESDPVLFVR